MQLRSIGILGFGPMPSPGRPTPSLDAFLQGLRERGYVEGKNLRIEARYAEGQAGRLKGLAESLVEAKVEVIFAGTTLAAVAAKNATRSVPIVMGSAADPVGAGLVSNLARPEGNVTGLTLETLDIAGKRLELLKQAIPGVRRVAALYPEEIGGFPVIRNWLAESERGARTLGLALEPVDLGLKPERWEQVFRETSARKFDAGVAVDSSVYFSHAARLAEASMKGRLPTMFPFRIQAEAGGLMAYGADTAHLWARAADYVARILQGAKPGDLPIEQPTRFELVVNLKAARALGIPIAQAIRVRADHVIE